MLFANCLSCCWWWGWCLSQSHKTIIIIATTAAAHKIIITITTIANQLRSLFHLHPFLRLHPPPFMLCPLILSKTNLFRPGLGFRIFPHTTEPHVGLTWRQCKLFLCPLWNIMRRLLNSEAMMLRSCGAGWSRLGCISGIGLGLLAKETELFTSIGLEGTFNFCSYLNFSLIWYLIGCHMMEFDWYLCL